MPIKSSGYYNDPALAQAAGNLAALFEPPSGSDAYGWAHAKSERAKEQRLADYFAYIQSPNVDPAMAEQLAIGNDLYDPNASFTAEGWRNATLRRGQDLDLTGTKYTADKSSAAAMYGHDQSLIGTKYTADVGRESNLDTALLSPVAENATRYVPPAIATARGVEATQPGVRTVGANEEMTVPGTDVVIKGPVTPLTQEQVLGQVTADLPIQQQQDLAMSKFETVMALNPVTNKIEVMSRGESDRLGATPIMSMDQVTGQVAQQQLAATENDPVKHQAVVDAIMARGQNAAAVKLEDGQALVNGKKVPVTRAPGERGWKFADGSAVPADVQVTNLETPSTATGELKTGQAIVNGQKVPVTMRPDERVWRTGDGAEIPSGVQVTNMETPSAETVKAAQTGQAVINGQKVPVTMKADETVWKTADGQPIPAGVQVTNMETPAQAPGPTDVANGQAILKNGKTVPVYQVTGEGIWRTQDTQPLDMTSVVSVTNLPTPQGATADIVPKTVESDVQKKIIDIGGTMRTAIKLREMVADAPSAAGLVGKLRGMTQDVIATGDEVGRYFGGSLAQVEADIRDGLVDPSVPTAQLFDKKIPAIEMMGNLLAYQYAKTLSEDRVSNESLKIARGLVGVDGLLANQQSISATLDQTLEAFQQQQKYLQGILKEGIGAANVDVPPPPPINQAGGASAAGQPGLTSTAPAAGERVYDKSGKRVQ